MLKEKQKSCLHQLLRLAEQVSTWFSKRSGGRTVALFIDAEKAFDSIWIDGLKKQLYDSKLPTKIIRWISSFLYNRQGRVRVNSCLSEKVYLLAGVPQGSIIAPLLYIFYIKDLPTKVFDALISSFYADDTSYAASDTLHKSSKTFVTDYLQPILTDLETFCAKWRMGLNPEKTFCLIFFPKYKK